MEIKKEIKKIAKSRLIGLIVLILMLYILINSIMVFENGRHNLDLSQNFLRLGFEKDKNVNGEIVNLEDVYLTSLGDIKNAFYWLAFDLILAILLGYNLRGKDE